MKHILAKLKQIYYKIRRIIVKDIEIKHEIKDGKISIYNGDEFVDSLDLKTAETIFFNTNSIFTIFQDNHNIEGETNPSVKQWFNHYKTKHINNLVSEKIKSIPDFENVVLNCIIQSFHNSKYSRFSHLMTFINGNPFGLTVKEMIGLFIIIDSMMYGYSGVDNICFENTELKSASRNEYSNWSYHVIPLCSNGVVSRFIKTSFKVKLNMRM